MKCGIKIGRVDSRAGVTPLWGVSVCTFNLCGILGEWSDTQTSTGRRPHQQASVFSGESAAINTTWQFVTVGGDECLAVNEF